MVKVKDYLSVEEIESKIVKEQYYKIGFKTTICCLTLENGFEVIGKSGVVNPEKYNQELGEQISKKRAVDQIWLIEGYLLQEKLYQLKNGE